MPRDVLQVLHAFNCHTWACVRNLVFFLTLRNIWQTHTRKIEPRESLCLKTKRGPLCSKSRGTRVYCIPFTIVKKGRGVKRKVHNQVS